MRAKNTYDVDWSISTQKYTTTPKYIQFSHANEKSLDINDTENGGSSIKDLDRLFLDFFPESTNYNELRNPSTRPHALINVNAAYDVRSGKNDDPLYIRIESEPAYNAQGGNQGNAPQQIIININADNTADSKRPLFFYYDGPLAERTPQPVILNLNADFQGVLYMPDVPVAINGNGHKFEGFIIANEFRYLAARGTSTTSHTVQITETVRTTETQWVREGWKWVQKEVTVDKEVTTNYTTIYPVDSKNNVQTVAATGDNAPELFDNNATSSSRFNLSSDSNFKKFTMEIDVNFMYVYYDYDRVMDSSPFYLNTGDLIPLYKLVDGKQVRVTNWDDVNLYDSDDMNTRNLIPKVVSDTSRKGTVRLTNGSPSPLYDEAGNAVYFCDDYVRLTGTYTDLTLDRVADGTRDPKEFLLTKTDELNVSNTGDWK